MSRKTEVSVVVRINAAYEGEDGQVKALELIRKIRSQTDGLGKVAGVTALNMDYTTSWSEPGAIG